MRNRIRKAIKASWRLPETIYPARFVVLISRLIVVLTAFIVPLVASVTFFVFFPHIYAVVFSAILTASTIVYLTWSFSTEYAEVRRVDALEKRILLYFHAFPPMSDLQLVEEGKNVWVAYGNIPREKMIKDVFKIATELSGGALQQGNETPKVEYLQATLPKTVPASLKIETDTKDTPENFPVTRLDINPCLL